MFYKQEQEEKLKKSSSFLTKFHEALRKHREDKRERRFVSQKSNLLKLSQRLKRVENEARDKSDFNVNGEKAAKACYEDPDLTKK